MVGIECSDKALVLRKFFIDFPTIRSALTGKRRAGYFTYEKRPCGILGKVIVNLI